MPSPGSGFKVFTNCPKGSPLTNPLEEIRQALEDWPKGNVYLSSSWRLTRPGRAPNSNLYTRSVNVKKFRERAYDLGLIDHKEASLASFDMPLRTEPEWETTATELGLRPRAKRFFAGATVNIPPEAVQAAQLRVSSLAKRPVQPQKSVESLALMDSEVADAVSKQCPSLDDGGFTGRAPASLHLEREQ